MQKGVKIKEMGEYSPGFVSNPLASAEAGLSAILSFRSNTELRRFSVSCSIRIARTAPLVFSVSNSMRVDRG